MPLRHQLDIDLIRAHPQWQTITDTERDAILKLVHDGHSVFAVKRIQSLTDCGIAAAHRAFHEVALGVAFQPPTSGTPCPTCGEPLRTDAALQCLACGADWH